MGYSFQKVYTLIAQTPMIHFQHDQKGATLRATEVKPKLDRYLYNHISEYPKKFNIVSKRISENADALNYKVQLERLGEYNTFELDGRKQFAIYYGNQGKRNEDKIKAIMGNIKMTLTCFDEELRDYIDSVIDKFFIVTNFGTMQNKGFGSFLVNEKNTDIKYIPMILKKEYAAEACYSFSGDRDMNTTFNRIKLIYSLMKTGVNYKGYHRSLLFEFMHEACGENGYGNEKAWMKQMGLAPAIGRQSNQQDDVHFYVRALLGIGDHFDFMNRPGSPNDKTTVTYKCVDGSIERFSSPIFFKVTNGKVYYIGKQIDKAIYGKEFIFKSNNGHSGKLRVPTEAELGDYFMEDFLEDCQKQLNEHVLGIFQDLKFLKIEKS